VVYLKNNGVATADNVTAVLRSPSGWVTLLDSTASFGAIPVGSEARGLPAYCVSVSDSVPVQEAIPFVLHTSIDGAFWKDLNFTVTANQPDTNGTDYYVFGRGDNNSGQRIVSALWTKGYKGKFYPDAKNLVGYPPIAGYRSVWCIVSGVNGNDSANYPVKTGSPTETLIINYLNNGGRYYHEDPDVGYASDPAGGRQMQNLKPYFRFSYASTGDYVRGFTGVTGTALFGSGMAFSYPPSDTGTSDFDSLSVGSGAIQIFRATQRPANNIGMMIAYDSGVYKTLLFDVPLGLLQDGTPPSTKAALVDSIMHWFGIWPSGVEVKGEPPTLILRTDFHLSRPNPTTGTMTFSYQLAKELRTSIKIYNLAGQLVRTLVDGFVPAGVHEALWDGRTENGKKAPAGVYLVRFGAGDYQAIKKAVILR
jgi:hypothetical protein